MPIAHQSRTSIATSTTAASTLVDERATPGSLTIDTSVGSSAASMLSSADSTQSAATNSSDIYGWEDELDRKSSIEAHQPRILEYPRRSLPSGGRTQGPRIRGDIPIHRRDDFRRKSLLHRVFSGSRDRRDCDRVETVQSAISRA